MSEVFVWPEEMSISIDGEPNLLDALTGAGVAIPHLCGGRARCSTCRVRVMAGGDHLPPRTPAEQAMAEKLDFTDDIRLACQTDVLGSVRLWRLVLDAIDIEMASQLGEPHYQGPVGREIEAVVMFVDVAGFTTMSEHLPPYDVVHILNRFFTRAGATVEACGGRVDNYMGDGFLALFGVHDEPDAALRAVEASLGFCEVESDMSNYVKPIFGHSFEVRVGVGLGDVILGLMGDDSSARETVIGDVVNTASRLESANKTTGTRILVTEAIHARTSTSVDYGQSFELDLHGKAGRVKAYEVLAMSAPPP
jgi:class 3 adenylate cyclase